MISPSLVMKIACASPFKEEISSLASSRPRIMQVVLRASACTEESVNIVTLDRLFRIG